MYQQPQQAAAAQFSGAFQTPAPDGDPWILQMSMPHMNNFNDRHSSVQQMQSSAPSLQTGWLASPKATEHQQIRSWVIHQLRNTPVGKSRGTIGNFMFKTICSKEIMLTRRPR